MTEQIVNFERMEYALTLFGNSDEKYTNAGAGLRRLGGVPRHRYQR